MGVFRCQKYCKCADYDSHIYITICEHKTQSTNRFKIHTQITHDPQMSNTIHKCQTQSTNKIHDLYEHKTCFLCVWVVLSHQIANVFVDLFWHLSTDFWHSLTGSPIHACVQPIRGLVGAIMSRLLRVLPRSRPTCLLMVRFPPHRCLVAALQACSQTQRLAKTSC